MKGKSPLTEIIFDFLCHADESEDCGFNLEDFEMTNREIIDYIDRFLDKRWESEQ